MVELIDADPFIWGRAIRGPVPYLWAECDRLDATDPVVHEVKETADGFNHRIIWRDNTGLTCTADVGSFLPTTLYKIYKKARTTAEEIEFYASGAIRH